MSSNQTDMRTLIAYEAGREDGLTPAQRAVLEAAAAVVKAREAARAKPAEWVAGGAVHQEFWRSVAALAAAVDGMKEEGR